MRITVSNSSSSTLGKGCGTVFFAIFAAAGILFSIFIGKAVFESLRVYVFTPTPCTIESAVVKESGGSHDLEVRYSYRFEGRTYTGTQFRAGMKASLDLAAAQRAAARYEAGSGATCYVNRSSPAESVLERGGAWVALLILFPLVFVAVGVGGIIAIWRAKPQSAQPISERHRARQLSLPRAMLGLRLFGLVFVLIGAGIMYVMLIRPMLKQFAAARWPEVPCEILSSRIASHRGSKGGSTYSVDIRYRYEFRGRTHTGSQYNFDTGTSSSRDWKQAAVDAHPPGKRTVCHVNPDDPFEAVLSTDGSPDRWFGLIPGVFLVVGLVIFLKAPAMAGANRTAVPVPAAPSPAPLRGVPGGQVELKPAASPMTGFLVVLFIALIWNGITWGILLTMPKGETFGRIFLGIFALVGAALGAAVVYQFLALFNPRPVLTASSPGAPLGSEIEVGWRFTGNVRRMRRLRISLEGREEATYRRGTTTTTDRNVFADITIDETSDHAAMASGSARVTIPADLMHTFTAPNNKIVWTLRATGDIPRWPDVGVEFPFTVLPSATAPEPA